MDIAQLIVSVIMIITIMHVFLIAGPAYGILLERKVASWAQDRIGPNRVGFGGLLKGVLNIVMYLPLIPLHALGLCKDKMPGELWETKFGKFLYNFSFFGLGQPIADGIKFFLKEDYNPGNVDKKLFIIAPVLAVIPAFLAWAIIPWGGYFNFPELTIFGHTIGGHQVAMTVADVNVGVIYILAITSLGVYGITIGAWAANNKYTFFGGIRATAQMLSYEIPMGLSVICILLLAGTTHAGDITAEQVGYWHGFLPSWYIFQQPVLAVMFYICVLAECNRAPFDLAEAEQELIGGFHTEYSSMKFALFFLGEYMAMMTGSAFFVVLFLGGWHLPYLDWVLYGGAQTANGAGAGGGLFGDWIAAGVPEFLVGLLGVGIKIGVLIAKIMVLFFLMMWIRWTVPRLRFDQLMRLAWRVLIPISIGMLLLTGCFVYMGWQDYMWAANIAMIAVILLVSPHMPRDENINRRVPLAGSRFNPLPSE